MLYALGAGALVCIALLYREVKRQDDKEEELNRYRERAGLCNEDE
jgi:hypothetical protein